MAKNRIINTKFWTDNFVLNELNPIDKLVYLYLITNPYTDICGIYELPIKIMAIETGIERENLEKVILPRFEESGKILYRDGWVAVKNFIKHQTLNPKVKIGIESGLLKAPKELRDFIGENIVYDSLSHLNSNSNSNTNSNNDKRTGKDFFEEFWKLYPKKQSKKISEKSWNKLNPSTDLFKKIIFSLEAHKKTEQWTKENGRFIPYPATWINQERWNDEIKTKKSWQEL